ncbi:MAG: glycosyltransferase family 4 protein [Firmicutes bacterium]|nr:glycosyltransferase family 4 protein [Bacillota bacterium]
MEEIEQRKLKIAIISPPWFPVPPTGYGGIELVVSLLTEGLCRKGHDVTLFASGDSITQARLISIFDKAPFKKMDDNIHLENMQSLAAYSQAEDFDIIHDHDGYGSRLLGAFTSRLLKKPVFATLHGPAEKQSLNFFHAIASDLLYVAISDFQRKTFGNLNFAATIPNAVMIDRYPFSESTGNYLLFVGRMNEEKGAHIAASVAKRTGKRLIMIGKCSENHEKQYFKDKVKPYLTRKIEYLGEVDHETKLELYQGAECTLFPIQWPEPFGLVMIESMACGTPVIAIRNGSVPEVIRDGQTGFIVDDKFGMIEALKKIDKIDRACCRDLVIKEYNEELFIDRHERIYRSALSAFENNLQKKRD